MSRYEENNWRQVGMNFSTEAETQHNQFSCAEISLQVICWCTSTTFLYHPLPSHLVPRDTNTATKSMEQGGSMGTANPCACGMGHPDRATPPGHSADRRGTHAPSQYLKVQALQSSTRSFPHCRVSGGYAQESCPRRCLS